MPPRGVKKGSKRARQYEHVKESAKEQGHSESRNKLGVEGKMTKDQLQRAVAGAKSR